MDNIGISSICTVIVIISSRLIQYCALEWVMRGYISQKPKWKRRQSSFLYCNKIAKQGKSFIAAILIFNLLPGLRESLLPPLL